MARIEYAAPFTMEELTAGMIETTGLDADTVTAWMNAVWGPGSVQARMYAATVSEVDGVQLLDRTTVETMTAVQTDKTRMNGLPPGLEVPPDRSFYMSLGFWRACCPMPWVGPRSFGHPGSGGSVGFGDPDAAIGFGYVTNLWSFRVGDPRASDLAAAVVACLG